MQNLKIIFFHSIQKKSIINVKIMQIHKDIKLLKLYNEHNFALIQYVNIIKHEINVNLRV